MPLAVGGLLTPAPPLDDVMLNGLTPAPPIFVSFVGVIPNTDVDEILTPLNRCDKLFDHAEPLDGAFKFDVLADVLELLQIGGGFE